MSTHQLMTMPINNLANTLFMEPFQDITMMSIRNLCELIETAKRVEGSEQVEDPESSKFPYSQVSIHKVRAYHFAKFMYVKI